VAVGCDGLMIEVHANPEEARSDGAQSLYPEQLEELLAQVRPIAAVLDRSLPRIPAPLDLPRAVGDRPARL
jgi:3-deoxy-7-phosphoheptulonate synthase